MTDLGSPERVRAPLTTIVLTGRLVAIAVTTAVVVLLVVAITSWRAGHASATHPKWLTGEGHFGADQMSVEVDGWTYGVDGSVPSWIDEDGTSHDAGWPDCFRVPAGTTRTVRFAAVEATVEDLGSRPIVVVDCRG